MNVRYNPDFDIRRILAFFEDGPRAMAAYNEFCRAHDIPDATRDSAYTSGLINYSDIQPLELTDLGRETLDRLREQPRLQ